MMRAMSEIRPYRIDVPAAVLDDLHARLARTRWPEAECVDDWSQGIPLAYTRELAAYWADGYDWRSREAALNRFDHYLTEIDGLDIHFIHQRSPHEAALPLVITHGWPGSVVEFHKVIEPLVNQQAGRAEDAFHVICPSLPGYGLSASPTHTRWGVKTKIGGTCCQFVVIIQNSQIANHVAESADISEDDQQALAAYVEHRKW